MTRAAVTGVLDDDDDETVSWTSSSRTSSSWDDANRDDASTSASNGTDDVDDFDDFDDDAGRRREMRALERQIETSVDALKLLYLIDRYTGGPRGVDDEFVGDFKDDDAPNVADGRRWIRLLPILVLIYEGCVRDRTFSYDYAPQSTLVSGACSRHLNVCQGGRTTCRRFARARLRRRAQGDVEGVRSRDAVGDFQGWKRVLASRRRLRDALGVDATKCGRVGARRESRVVARGRTIDGEAIFISRRRRRAFGAR